MTTDFEYLLALPAPIQSSLVSLVRAAAGTSLDEKVAALTAMTGCAEALFDHVLANGGSFEPVNLMAAVGEFIGAMDRATEPAGEVV